MKTRLMIERLVKQLFGDENPSSGTLAEYKRVFNEFNHSDEWHTAQDVKMPLSYIQSLAAAGLLETRITPLIKNGAMVGTKTSYRRNISGDLS